ncbi:MAG: TRAM domain-containing protein, partial [Christensenella sp.]|uniref:PIN/TRAM domain-containing protein n=1 Tax=Christensenella sp. TaxID=1935934 RepID=UPI002B1FDBE6
MQKELTARVRVTDVDYEDVPEVDIKLLKLAKDIGGTVVTNDYNLNKVAAVQDVAVFNINELANAVKPILMAGEEMSVTIVKDGKEQSQGIGYLDDGTMIVVEGAKGMSDKTLSVIVTSVLQTAAGRMIFAKIK